MLYFCVQNRFYFIPSFFFFSWPSRFSAAQPEHQPQSLPGKSMLASEHSIVRTLENFSEWHYAAVWIQKLNRQAVLACNVVIYECCASNADTSTALYSLFPVLWVGWGCWLHVLVAEWEETDGVRFCQSGWHSIEKACDRGFGGGDSWTRRAVVCGRGSLDELRQVNKLFLRQGGTHTHTHNFVRQTDTPNFLKTKRQAHENLSKT